MLNDKDKGYRFAYYKLTKLRRRNNYNSLLSNNDFRYKDNKYSRRYYKDKEDKRLSNSSKATFKSIKRLKPDKVRYFDGFTKVFIAAYYKRLNFLVYAYKELAILITLLLYIRADASNLLI
jgi:hypothetical protein